MWILIIGRPYTDTDMSLVKAELSGLAGFNLIIAKTLVTENNINFCSLTIDMGCLLESI